MNRDGVAEKSLSTKPHVVTLESRQRALLSGVTDVLSFNEQEVVLVTDEGDITLVGEGLHISRLSLDEGQLVLEGEIAGIEYGLSSQHRKSGSLWSRLFK